LGETGEADDDRAVLGRVEFPVLIVDGERLTLSVANRSVVGSLPECVTDVFGTDAGGGTHTASTQE
jgi:hypothetical protein